MNHARALPAGSLPLNFSFDQFYRLCQERFALFYRERRPAFQASLADVIDFVATRAAENLASGRAQRLLGLPPASWPLEPALFGYIDRILMHADSTYDFHARLRSADTGTWHALYDALVDFATRALAKHGPGYDFAADHAHDYASLACERIHAATYPADVDFMAWAFRILLNTLRAPGRSTDVTSRFPFLIESLDAPLPGDAQRVAYDLHADPAAAAALQRVENRAHIMQLLDRSLDARQRDIIIATFFDESSDIDIARELETTPSNVQVIRHRALRRLQHAVGQLDEAGRKFQHAGQA